MFTLPDALRRAAQQHPDRLAVSDGDAGITYEALEEMSARYTAVLVDLGVQPGDRVAVWAEKSITTVAALYGAMAAGAAYVPIDPSAPPLRAAGMLEDAGVRVLCADAKAVARLGEAGMPSPAPLLAFDSGVAPAAAGPADVDGAYPVRSGVGCESDLAYILYTSGSTGRPKGVMLSHRNALSFVEWAVGRFAVDFEDRLVSHAPFHFDLSVFDLYGAALAGACVHLLRPEAARFGAAMAAAVRDNAITVWYSVPSALVLLLDSAAERDLASLRAVLFAGEVFPTKHLRRLRSVVNHATLANLYGPTETNVCTYYVVPPEVPLGDASIPIGKACENQEVFALDERLRRTPPGEVGELWVRGPTVMQGYWGDPEKTSRTRQQNPLHDGFPDPCVRTGDLVRLLPTGDYEFLGRRDQQVKSRGYRIELGELEAVLATHPAVREAAVVAVPDEDIGNVLVAYVTATAGTDPLDLKRHCSQRLPRYMIPGAVELCDTLPRTSTDKVDRQALTARARAAAEPC